MRRFALCFLLLAGCGDHSAGSNGHGLFPANAKPGLDPFDPNVLSVYQITIDPGDWSAICADPKSDVYRRCTLDWQGEIYYDVAVRGSGQRSAVPGNPKPSLHISFDEFVPGRRFHSRFVNSLKLNSDTNDPSMVRRRIEDGIYRASGLAAPRYAHCRLYVNGAYTGCYGAEERIRKGFLEEHFGDVDHQLYSWSGHGNDVSWMGSDPSAYDPWMFIPEIDSVTDNPADIRDFVNIVNNFSWADMAARVDVDMFCRFMAAEVATGEGDAYVAIRYNADGTFNSYRTANFMVYEKSNAQYMLLAWDRDQGYWVHRDSIFFGFDGRILTSKIILANSATMSHYKSILSHLAHGASSTDSIQAQINFLVNQLSDAVNEDPYKSAGTYQNWLLHMQGIVSYAQQHNQMILSQVQ